MERRNMHVQHNIEAGSQFCMECPTMCGAILCCSRRMFSFLLACDVFLENREITYFIGYNGWSECLCAPDDIQHTSFLPYYFAQFDCLEADHQGQGDTRLSLTPSVIPISNYVIMASDWNCLKYFYLFLHCNHQVQIDFLIACTCHVDSELLK
jgi:hypothetical protein